MQPLAQPVAGEERLEHIDLVRGYALLGVLLMNHHFFFRAPDEIFALKRHLYPGALEAAIDTFLRIFFSLKSYTMFSMLFAIGLCIQRERALAKGVDWNGYALRRLFALLGFGALHIVLIWSGDILHQYALVGLVLLLFLGRSDKTIKRWLKGMVGFALAALLAMMIFRMIKPPAVTAIGLPPEQAARIQKWVDASIHGYLQPSWVAVMRFRLRDYVHFTIQGGAIFGVVLTLANFLVGVWFWRQGALRAPREHRALIGRVALWGIGFGLLAAILSSFGLQLRQLLGGQSRWLQIVILPFGLAQIFGPLVFASGLGAGLVWLWEDARWRERLRPLTWLGRMAFTNYIIQSMICSFIYYGWGLGYFNRMGSARGLLICIAIYGIQIVWSRWWLARFRFGPLEWLWRVLTYRQLQPFRRAAAALPALGYTEGDSRFSSSSEG